MSSPDPNVSIKDALQHILVEKAFLAVKKNTHATPDPHLVLTEVGKDATLKQLTLTHLRDTDICITFDIAGGQQFKGYSAYFKSSKGEGLGFNKRCDFIIVRKEGDEWQVYFGDMKSTRVEAGNILKQLSASQLFFDYVSNIIKLVFNNDNLSGYVAKYVCIHDNAKAEAGISLRSTTIPNNAIPYVRNIDDKSLIIMPVAVLPDGRARLSFNQLMGKINKKTNGR